MIKNGDIRENFVNSLSQMYVWHSGAINISCDEQVITIEPTGSITFYKTKPSLMLHREDGPAIVYSDGETEYWISGQPIDALQHFVQYGSIKKELTWS